MPYLTLDGVNVPVQRGGLLEPSRYGETVRMYDNTLRSTEEPTLRTRRWQFTTGPLSGAEWDAIRPLIRSVAIRTALGYAVTRGAVGIAVLCVPGEVTHEPAGDTDIAYVATFILLERGTGSGAIGGTTTGLYLYGDASDIGGGALRTGVSGGSSAGGEATGGAPALCGTLVGGVCDTLRCPAVTTIVATWYSDPATADGMLDGPAFLSVGAIGINPWGTWWTQRVGFQMAIYRAGSVVSGPYAFTTAAVDFSGGTVVLQTVSPLVAVPILTGDRLKFEALTIIGINGCASDDGFRPRMGYGGFFPPSVVIPGTVLF